MKLLVALMALLVLLPSTALARPPAGYAIMCLEYQGSCNYSGASKIGFSDELFSTLSQVNRQINARIRPRADGPVDEWKLNVSSGECEEYAIAKRMKLISLGYPSAALRFAFGKNPDGEGHVVLVVRTNNGDYVLDNLRHSVEKWRLPSGWQFI